MRRLIDANSLSEKIGNMKFEITNNRGGYKYCNEDEKNEWDKLDSFDSLVCDAPTVDAVEVPDKELLRAIKLLIKQYEHSKNSEYVHSPVAHALYHTWRQVDERRTDHV